MDKDDNITPQSTPKNDKDDNNQQTHTITRTDRHTQTIIRTDRHAHNTHRDRDSNGYSHHNNYNRRHRGRRHNRMRGRGCGYNSYRNNNNYFEDDGHYRGNNYIPTLYISWCFNNGCNNNNNINANSNGFNNYQPPVQDINGTTSAYNPPSSPTYTLKTDENEPVPISNRFMYNQFWPKIQTLHLDHQ